MVNKKIKVGIIGSTGYTGQELMRILSTHYYVEIVCITSNSYVGEKYSSIYGNHKKINDLICDEENIEELAIISDVIFIALPHGMSSKKVTKEILEKTKVIDLGADFRLKDKKLYKKWYLEEHENSELLGKSVYGLSECNRESIKNANLIANPGCYATCSLLSLIPLVSNSLINVDDIIIDAKSGISGAGRSLSLGNHFVETNESIKAYNVLKHRHTPEINQELLTLSDFNVNIIFTPHLIPMNRGILTTSYCKLNENLSYKDVKNVFENFYEKNEFIRILDENVFPETRFVKNSNYFDVNFKVCKETKNLIVIGVIDNLIKGASGQAVQNMNLMFDFDEGEGLRQIPNF